MCNENVRCFPLSWLKMIYWTSRLWCLWCCVIIRWPLTRCLSPYTSTVVVLPFSGNERKTITIKRNEKMWTKSRKLAKICRKRKINATSDNLLFSTNSSLNSTSCFLFKVQLNNCTFFCFLALYNMTYHLGIQPLCQYIKLRGRVTYCKRHARTRATSCECEACNWL